MPLGTAATRYSYLVARVDAETQGLYEYATRRRPCVFYPHPVILYTYPVRTRQHLPSKKLGVYQFGSFSAQSIPHTRYTRYTLRKIKQPLARFFQADFSRQRVRPSDVSIGTSRRGISNVAIFVVPPSPHFEEHWVGNSSQGCVKIIPAGGGPILHIIR